LLPVVIVAAGIGISAAIASNPPKAKEKPLKAIAQTVTVVKANLQTEQVKVSGFGIIQAKKIQQLIMQVAGVVAPQSRQLLVGDKVKQSEPLLQLETHEYEMKVIQAQATQASAQADLTDELGRQYVGQQEWQRMETSTKEGDLQKRLILRTDQLLAKEAALASAKSSLALTKLDLSRTYLQAACDGFVESENLEVGQVVKVGEQVATVICNDTFEVVTNISLNDLQWLTFPDANGQQGSPVKIIQTLGNGKTVIKEGQVSRLMGSLDQAGRMAQVIVEIPKPMDDFPLLIGAYVQVLIEGLHVDRIAQLPRALVHENDQVWLMDKEGKLAFRQVEVLFAQNDQLYISSGLRADDAIVSSYIPTPLNGMQLKIIQ